MTFGFLLFLVTFPLILLVLVGRRMESSKRGRVEGEDQHEGNVTEPKSHIDMARYGWRTVVKWMHLLALVQPKEDIQPNFRLFLTLRTH